MNEAANTFNIAFDTGDIYSGNIVKVRIGSPDSEPIAEAKLESNNWNELIIVEAPLKEALEAGIYDIYLTFEEEGKCSDVYWFGFSSLKGATEAFNTLN